MMARYPSDHDPRPRQSITEDEVSDGLTDAQRHADAAYRGHRVVDGHHRPIGKVTDVIYDDTGVPKWAVISPGIFRSEHFLPLDHSYLSLEGNLVVPFDKRTVARSPKAERDHVLTPIIERALEQYYQLAA
jgi:hypothetical protein